MGFKIAELREILGEAYTDDIGKKLVAQHRSVVDPLLDDLESAKSDATKYKAEAEKVPGLQKDLDEAKKGEDWKDKYEKEHQSFEDYKTKIAQDAEAVKVEAAYRKLLTEEKVSEKAMTLIIAAKKAEFSKMKLKEDGTLDGAEDLKKEINEKYADFRVSQRQRGEQVGNPPAGAPGGSDSSVREYVRKMHEARYGAPPQQN